jgi:hypothetical protein
MRTFRSCSRRALRSLARWRSGRHQRGWLALTGNPRDLRAFQAICEDVSAEQGAMFERMEAEEARWRADPHAPISDALLRLISFRETRRRATHPRSCGPHRSMRPQPPIQRARNACGSGRPRARAVRSSARSGDSGGDSDSSEPGEARLDSPAGRREVRSPTAPGRMRR